MDIVMYLYLKSVGLVLMVWMLVPRFKACYRSTLFDNRRQIEMLLRIASLFCLDLYSISTASYPYIDLQHSNNPLHMYLVHVSSPTRTW
ncbi:hypothetical protein F4815DRAFT_473859 [Daldinia loculata]|nr:hypothetical protein F4815DRAFT_473859 [Daldinia loculata]